VAGVLLEGVLGPLRVEAALQDDRRPEREHTDLCVTAQVAHLLSISIHEENYILFALLLNMTDKLDLDDLLKVHPQPSLFQQAISMTKN
jgi:hypothetical protein